MIRMITTIIDKAFGLTDLRCELSQMQLRLIEAEQLADELAAQVAAGQRGAQ